MSFRFCKIVENHFFFSTSFTRQLRPILTLQLKMIDLQNKSYRVDVLVSNIYAVSLVDVYKTQQNLPKEFLVDYILNPEYQLTEEEMLITIHDVLEYQNHLSIDDIFESLKTSCRREKFDFSWV